MRRKYRISGLTSQATRELTFPVDERGTMKSVVEYFQETYGFVIQHTQWPCLQVGNQQRPNYLPMEQLCSWDPLKRPTADQCLQHPFFHVGKCIPRPPGDLLQLRLSNCGSKPNLELNLRDYGTSRDDCFLGLTLPVNPSASNLGMLVSSYSCPEK